MDQDGVVLDNLVRSRRGAQAAKRLLRKPMKRRLKRQTRAPRDMITGKLRSYSAAARTIVFMVKHRQRNGLNSRVGNSRQPTRRGKRITRRFKSPGQARCFLAKQDHAASIFTAPTTRHR